MNHLASARSTYRGHLTRQSPDSVTRCNVSRDFCPFAGASTARLEEYFSCTPSPSERELYRGILSATFFDVQGRCKTEQINCIYVTLRTRSSILRRIYFGLHEGSISNIRSRRRDTFDMLATTSRSPAYKRSQE